MTERLKAAGVIAKPEDLRCDLIGIDALHGPQLSAGRPPPYEVRLRVAGRTRTVKDAARIVNEVETLYTNGPAGGGGVTGSSREVLAVVSTLVPRELVHWNVAYHVV